MAKNKKAPGRMSDKQVEELLADCIPRGAVEYEWSLLVEELKRARAREEKLEMLYESACEELAGDDW